MSEARRAAKGVGLVVLACVLAGCGGREAEPQPAAGVQVREATVTIEPSSGSQVTGQGTFALEGDQVVLHLSLQNLPAGVHAVHIHEAGDCSAPVASSAGAHWNPMGHDHGQWNQVPFHLGDLGNVEAGEDGHGHLSLTTSLWTLGTGEPDDVVGKSIIVHEKADDFVTQPTGAAGGRIGCGVITAHTTP